ncbi:MAG: SiaB family protein kinase [Bacteroidetes bacterium]|nr:SiaB family protein kinase [Bacteroidota bacterium]
MYKRMEGDDIILAFKGNITEELLTSVFQIMESRLEMSPAELRLKKKVNNILVECLQNVYHHMEDFTDDEQPEDRAGSAMFLICQDKNNRYRIITGNHILTTHVEGLKTRIDEVNAMTAEELKAHYIEALRRSELSDKGGAGLGLIDMARKSGKKINYRFDAVNNRLSFFSLVISVD